MKYTYFALSRRYAQAFLHVFYPVSQDVPLEAYEKLLDFFKAQKGIIGLIANCPCPHSCYSQLEDFLIKKFGLTPLEKKLFHKLLLDHQIKLLPSILEQIIDIEHKRRGELICTIELSHVVPKDIEQKLIAAFEALTHQKLIPKITIQPNLICGFRIYSKTLSYEQSINKSLNNAKSLAKTKGGLW